MIIKCPYCGHEKQIDYDEDIEAKIWNFNGVKADITMVLYCDHCEEVFEAEIQYKLTNPTIKNVYKR